MDSDEEEVFLLVELNGLPTQDTIQTCQGTCAILGVDSDEPVVQVDNYVFKGRYKEILGTAMIFQQDKGRRLKYLCKTGKKLTMQRVFLKKRAGEEQHPPSSTATSSQRTSAAAVGDRTGTSDGHISSSSTPLDGDMHMDTSSAPGLGVGTEEDPGPIPMLMSSDLAH